MAKCLGALPPLKTKLLSLKRLFVLVMGLLLVTSIAISQQLDKMVTIKWMKRETREEKVVRHSGFLGMKTKRWIENHLVITIQVWNNTEKPITNISARLQFFDVFNNYIRTYPIRIDELINSKNAVTITYDLTYTDFIMHGYGEGLFAPSFDGETFKRLCQELRLKMAKSVSAIVFKDGTVLKSKEE